MTRRRRFRRMLIAAAYFGGITDAGTFKAIGRDYFARPRFIAKLVGWLTIDTNPLTLNYSKFLTMSRQRSSSHE